jgi:hypothetical protein
MKPQPRQTHITRSFAGVQQREDPPQSRLVLGWHPATIADRNRRSKPLCRKRLIAAVTYNVTRD